MLKHTLIACAVLAVSSSVVFANGAKKGMCVKYEPVEIPCPSEAPPAKSEAPPPARAEKVSEKTRSDDDICVQACLSERAWELSHSKRWWADSKDHRHRTERFDTQCGRVCRPRGFPKMGHLSKDTNEWTVFRFGHKDD